MNRITYAALAAALVVVIGGGAYLLTSNHPSVGAPSPSPSAVATTSAAPAAVAAPAAQAIWGDWVADVNLGLRDQGPRIQMSINWDGGKEVWIQTNYVTGTRVFDSDVIAAPTGQLGLVSKITVDGCNEGDVGRYGWARSANGEFLRLTLISDQCAARSAALARAWVHTLNAVNDGGLGVLPVDNLEMTLPARTFGLSYWANGPYDKTLDAPDIEFLAIKNPTPFKVQCGTSLGTGAALTDAAKLVAYIKTLPDFTFTSSAGSVDGHPATHLTGTPRAGYACPSGSVSVFWGSGGDNGGDSWTVSPENTTSLSVWITQNGPDAWIFWYFGDQVSAADEAAVIGSIHFISGLPTP